MTALQWNFQVDDAGKNNVKVLTADLQAAWDELATQQRGLREANATTMCGLRERVIRAAARVIDCREALAQARRVIAGVDDCRPG